MCYPGQIEVRMPGAGRPRWAALYGATLPQLVALAAVEVSAPSNPLRAILRWTLALGTFVGMGLWVRSSRAAFDLENWCACAPEKITVRVIESRRPAYTPPHDDPLPSWVEEPAEPALR